MASSSKPTTVQEKLVHEMRRGTLILAVLSQLQTARYGYALKQSLSEKGLDINEGTLYPLLRRLEGQGLLQSEWRVIDDARPRRYYKISDEGQTVFANLSAEFHSMTQVMQSLLDSSETGGNDERE